MFRLTRYYAIVSLAVFILVVVLLSLFYLQMHLNPIIIAGGTALILAALYTVLFLVIRHADRIIGHQYEETQRANTELAKARDDLKILNAGLEQRVQERTFALTQEAEQHKQTEERVRRSQGFLENVLASTSDVMSVINLNDYSIAAVNRAFLETYGLKEKDAIGKKCYEITHHRSDICEPPNDICPIPEALRTGTHARVEHIHYHKDGTKRWVEVIASPVMDTSGDITQVIHSARDITERRKAEQALRQKNEELEVFAYSAAHDLRAPLVTVGTFAGTLRTDLEKNRPERVEEDIRLIQNGISKMHRLLQKTLEYGRSGRTVVPDENVPFREIIDESLRQVTGQVSLSGANVSLAETFPTACVDRQAMVQVLNNLISNSTQYRDKSRPLVIEMGHRFANDEVIYFVRDNGMGISPEQQEKVFELFYRGASESQGAGLGLALVKRTIEGHGGRVWLESEPGKGTTFYFTLTSHKVQ